MTESFAELFEQSLTGGQSMQPGTIVNAVVLEVKPDVVIVDAGLKSEGVIPIQEFQIDGAEAKVAVGDHIEVALETVEDGFGVYPPLPGQYGATSGPYANPASTAPGQTWDEVTATLTGPRLAPPQPLVVNGPDGPIDRGGAVRRELARSRSGRRRLGRGRR